MSLENITGQPRAKRFLKQIQRRDHIPHALLFTGMAGIGRKRMAREFSKALNCLAPRDFDACDECAQCRKMAGGRHPDFLWIESETTVIKIDQIRGMRDRLRFRPFEGKWRVVVIEDAQKLKEEAANSLLKILEEPPGRNLFILLTLEPRMLLPTIVSRCCHVRFQPLEDSFIEHFLVTDRGMSEAMAREAARLAGGSLERAAWWAESDRVSRWRGVLEKVRKLRGLDMFDFFNLMAEWTKTSEDLEQDLECIKLWLRDLIISLLTEDEAGAAFGPGAMAEDMLPESGSVMDLFLLYDETEAAMRHLKQYANKQLTLEGVCLAIKGKLYGEGNWNTFSRGW